jgi:hypothetical protein
MLGHLGWVQFSNGVSANTHKEFALEILMTMAPILDEGVQSLSFRLEEIQQVVPMNILWTSLVFEYLKQRKYISGDERGGFNVAKVNLPLLDPRLRLFIQGKEDWLEEGLLVLARKNKRGRIIEEGSSSAQEGGARQNYVPPYGGIPTPLSYYGGPPMQAWGSGAVVPPPNYVVPNVTFA